MLRGVERGRARFGIAVEHGEVELIFLGIEVDEQVIDLVQDFLSASVGAVNLVDDHDYRHVGFQGFGQHVARLRQRAFAGIDQQHNAIHHL